MISVPILMGLLVVLGLAIVAIIIATPITFIRGLRSKRPQEQEPNDR